MMVSTGIFRRYRNIKHYCTAAKTFQEVRIPVPWGHIAGKWWGPTDKRPVLCLHGWQDNCGTFNRIIPLLNNKLGYLAIDFQGHGLSSNLPSGIYINNTEYIILVQYLAKYFNWPKISLLGHSMGGIISYVNTMLYPQKIDFSICIDLAKPIISKNNSEKMARNIQRFFKYEEQERSSKEPPSYYMEDIKKRICKGNNNSIAYEHSHHIAQRNIARSKIEPDKFYFTRDPRIKAFNLVNFCQEELKEAAKGITTPLLICKATEGSYYEDKKYFNDIIDIIKTCNKRFEYHKVKGTHHLHLNTPEELADIINKLVSLHDTETRDVGGMKQEIIFDDRAELQNK